MTILHVVNIKEKTITSIKKKFGILGVIYRYNSPQSKVSNPQFRIFPQSRKANIKTIKIIPNSNDRISVIFDTKIFTYPPL